MSGELYHFTCSHAEPLIDATGCVRPVVAWRNLDAVLCRAGLPMTGLWRAPAVVWLTHEGEPDREALGLTSHLLKCDRTEFRYTVEGRAVAWMDFARQHNANRDWLNKLTGTPHLWLVSTAPLRVTEKLVIPFDTTQVTSKTNRSQTLPAIASPGILPMTNPLRDETMTDEASVGLDEAWEVVTQMAGGANVGPRFLSLARLVVSLDKRLVEVEERRSLKLYDPDVEEWDKGVERLEHDPAASSTERLLAEAVNDLLEFSNRDMHKLVALEGVVSSITQGMADAEKGPSWETRYFNQSSTKTPGIGADMEQADGERERLAKDCGKYAHWLRDNINYLGLSVARVDIPLVADCLDQAARALRHQTSVGEPEKGRGQDRLVEGWASFHSWEGWTWRKTQPEYLPGNWRPASLLIHGENPRTPEQPAQPVAQEGKRGG